MILITLKHMVIDKRTPHINRRKILIFFLTSKQCHTSTQTVSPEVFIYSQCLRCSSQPLYSLLCTCTQAKIPVASKQTLKEFFFTFRAVKFRVKFNLQLYFSHVLTSGPSIPYQYHTIISLFIYYHKYPLNSRS